MSIRAKTVLALTVAVAAGVLIFTGCAATVYVVSFLFAATW